MFDWTPSFIGAICVICALAALTMPAGIGGGILFVPVLRLVGNMDQSGASALSQVLITGASIGSIIYQWSWQHRHKEEPLLAQPFFVVVMLPALLSGSLVGVYLNNLLPDVISLIVLVCLCIVSSVMIFRKGRDTYRKENLVFAAARVSATTTIPSNEVNMLPPPMPPMDRGISLVSLEVGINVPPEVGMYDEIESPPQSFMYEDTAMMTPSHSAVSIASLRKRERSRRMSSCGFDEFGPGTTADGVDHTLEDTVLVKHSRLMQLATKSAKSFTLCVVAYWCYLVLFTILRGSRSNPSFSGIPPCGAGYWALSGVQAGSGIVLSLLVAFKEARLIAITFCTGMLATLSGASGGIILNPLLLGRGLDPQQTSATSTVIMFVMASCSALEFLMSGKVKPILATLMLVTFAGSVIGMTLVTWLIKALGRQSILVFLLGGLVVVGGGMLLYLGSVDIVRAYQAGEDPFELGELC